MAICFSLIWFLVFVSGSETPSRQIAGQDLHSQEIRDAAERGKQFLLRRQKEDGSFPADGVITHRPGVTSLALMALLETGLDQRSPQIERATSFLRNLPFDQPETTHEIALVLLAMLSLRDQKDLPRITQLSRRLEQHQGDDGGWRSLPDDSASEPSLTQLAILALRESSRAGVTSPSDRWRRARSYWHQLQNPDGSWGMPIANPKERDQWINLHSSTLAASSSLSICNQMIATQDQVSGDGNVDCCQHCDPDPVLQRGRNWLQQQIQVASSQKNPWSFMSFRLRGLEQTTQTRSLEHPDEQSWYNQSLLEMLQRQNATTGHWEGNNEVVATSHNLLFLSRELAPVLINKLVVRDQADLTSSEGRFEQTTPQQVPDVSNLVGMLSERPRWPRLLSSQEVEFRASDPAATRKRISEAPILFLTGLQIPQLSESELVLIRRYLDEGGVLFAAPGCERTRFERDFRNLVARLVPETYPLTELPVDHPLYWSEFVLNSREIKLYGVETGCRTSIIYCPQDLGCLWSLWTRFEPNSRPRTLQNQIQQAMEIGANVCAYASGREPLNRFDIRRLNQDMSPSQSADRRMTSIALVRHAEEGSNAPRALSHLLQAVNRTTGMLTSANSRTIELTDRELFRYPLLYMHGSYQFTLSEMEVRALKIHLERGGFLFADACCGSKRFDESFRTLMNQIASPGSLKTISNRHEIFSERVGHQLQQVRFQRTTPFSAEAPGDSTAPTLIEPSLEGIELDGRLAVIYSKYDLSCALDRPLGYRCDGYVPEDAIRIATNIVLYSLLQEQRFSATREVSGKRDSQSSPAGSSRSGLPLEKNSHSRVSSPSSAETLPTD